MKKIILIGFLIFSICSWHEQVEAGNITQQFMKIAKSRVAAGGWPENQLSFWDGDYNGESEEKYIEFNDGGSTQDGTSNGTIEISVTYGFSGQGVRFNNANEHIYWTSDSTEKVNPAIGTVWVLVFVPDDGDLGTNTLFTYYVGADDFLYMFTDTTNNIVNGCYEGSNSGGCISGSSTSGMTQDVWWWAGYTWNDSTNVHCSMACEQSVGCGGESWFCDTGDTLGTFASTSSAYISIGHKEKGAISEAIYIDQMQVYDTYQNSYAE